MPSKDRENRTPEEIAEHYRQRDLRRDTKAVTHEQEKKARREAQVAERDERRAAGTAAREERREASSKRKDERTTEKMKKRSDAYIKYEKKKLEREEERRLKNRDERELSRLDVRVAGVEERKQKKINVGAQNERDWAASLEAEAEKRRKGDEVVRQIEAAKSENRRKARLIK